MLLKVVAVEQPERRAKFLLSWADAKRKNNSGDVQNQRARCYEEAARVTQNKRTKARSLLDLGDVEFRFLGDGNAALSCYRTVANENADGELARRAIISQGDAYLLSGDLATAGRLYEEAGVLPEHERGAEALRTSYGNLIEGYIKQKDFDAALEAIERGEWKYPMIKTRGYSFILRAHCVRPWGHGRSAEVRRLHHPDRRGRILQTGGILSADLMLS
jgi:tetratricopeptide (TPR) repeat protein